MFRSLFLLDLIIKFIILSSTLFCSVASAQNCVAPQLEIEGKSEYTICATDENEITFSAVQTNNVPITDVEWYYRYDKTWYLIGSETDLSITLNNPSSSAEYLILAYNDDCVSDSIIFKLEVKQEVILSEAGGLTICEGNGVLYTLNIESEENDSVTYFFGDDPVGVKDEYLIPNILRDTFISYYATNGACKSNVLRDLISVELRTKLSMSASRHRICEGDEVELEAVVENETNPTLFWQKLHFSEDVILWDPEYFNYDNYTTVAGNVNSITVNPYITSFYVVAARETEHCPVVYAEDEYIYVQKPLKLKINDDDINNPVCYGETVVLHGKVEEGERDYIYWTENGNVLKYDDVYVDVDIDIDVDVDVDVVDDDDDDDDEYDYDEYDYDEYDDDDYDDYDEYDDDDYDDYNDDDYDDDDDDDYDDDDDDDNHYGYFSYRKEIFVTVVLKDQVDENNQVHYEFIATGDLCPAETLKLDITVKEQEMIEIKAPAAICEGEDLNMEVNGEDGKIYNNLVWERKLDNEAKYVEVNTFTPFYTDNPPVGKVTYRLSGQKNGCDANPIPLEIDVLSTPHVDLDVPSIICDGEMFNLNAHVDGEYTSSEWLKNGDVMVQDMPSVPVHITQNTTFSFVARNENCVSDAVEVDVEIQKPETLSVTTNKKALICEGDEVELFASASDATHLEWESKGDGESDFHPLNISDLVAHDNPTVSTEYRVKGKINGCDAIPMPITIDVTSTESFNLDDKIICEDDVALLNLPNGYSYNKIEWHKENDSTLVGTGNSVEVSPTETTNYYATLITTGCESEAHMTVKVEETPHIVSHEMLDEKSCQLNVDANVPVYFQLSGNEEKTTSDILTDLMSGKSYQVEVATEAGCSSSYTFSTPVIELIFPPYFYQGEENWKVVNIEKFDNYTVTIFDRYGKLLATMVNDPEGWDGVYNGYKMPSTDYWYKVDVESTDKQYAGHFTLLRKK